MEQPFQTRAVVVPLDPTPAEEQLLRSYCSAARFAYNRTIGLVKENLDARSREREDGVGEGGLVLGARFGGGRGRRGVGVRGGAEDRAEEHRCLVARARQHRVGIGHEHRVERIECRLEWNVLVGGLNCHGGGSYVH